MITLLSKFFVLGITFRLLLYGGPQSLSENQYLQRARVWREKARAAPRCSYKQINYYRRALQWEPTSAVTHLELGEVYYDLAISYGHQDLFQEAIKYFSSALEYTPDLVEAHYRLGAIYFLRRDFKRARQELEKAGRINPDYRPVQNSLRRWRPDGASLQ